MFRSPHPSTPRGLKYTCHDVNKHIIGVLSSSTSSDEEYFSAREFFYRGIFLPGNLSAGEFFASSQESSSSSSVSNLGLEYYVVVP